MIEGNRGTDLMASRPGARPASNASAAADAATRAPASPGRAAVLSFILPGLGQLALGAVRSGLFLAIPIVLTVAVAAFLLIADRNDLVSGLFDPSVVLALVALDLVLGLLHLVAIGDAYRVARRRLRAGAWSRPGSPRLLAVLLAVTFLLHGTIGVVGYQVYETWSTVFQPPNTGYVIPPPSFGPNPGQTAAPGQTEFQVSAFPGPAWAADGRLNILLIGGDAGPGRWSLRTDTMIVMSADMATGRVALFGIPRNIINAPLAPEDAQAFPDGKYPDLLNGLWVYADTHPSQFPGTDTTRGFRAITGAVQQLIGVPLDGAVVVNLNGFVDLVDAVGGLWINVPYPILDDAYPLEDGSGYITLNIKAGCQHFDGHVTLEFARSRHQSSDYQRMDRQQIVLQDLANQLDPISLIMQVPTLLQVAGDNIRTTFQPSDMGQLLRFADEADRKDIIHVYFDPPDYPEVLTNTTIKHIQRTVRNVFATPAPGASGAPSPTPTAAPTGKACPPAQP